MSYTNGSGYENYSENNFHRRRFCKQIQIIHSNFMRIPAEFVKEFMTPSPKHVTFSTRDKQIWAITISRHMGELYFTHGWPEFKAAYNITLRQSVEFDYDGETHFQVYIYKRNDVEKKLTRLGSGPMCEHFHYHSNIVDPLWDVTRDYSTSGSDVETDDDELNCDAESSVGSTSIFMQRYPLDSGSRMSDEERNRIFDGFLPNCFISLRRSDWPQSNVMTLPDDFARSELEDGDCNIRLHVYEVGVWDVKCVSEYVSNPHVGPSAAIVEGWQEFVNGVQIKFPDSVAFQRSTQNAGMWNVMLFKEKRP